MLKFFEKKKCFTKICYENENQHHKNKYFAINFKNH